MRNFQPAWNVEYDCSVLPNVATPSWNDVRNINMMSIVNGMLYINDNSSSTYSWLGMTNIVNPDRITTLEFNIKMVSASNFLAMGTQIIDGQKGISLGLEPTKINILFQTQVIKSIDVDLTNFNIIKIIKYGQTKFEIYINDILVAEDNHFNNESENTICLGSQSSKDPGCCYIKNIRYCLDGIPINFSNFYLIKQDNNYYSINNNYIDLGKIDNNEELNNIIDEYGYNDISILTKELNSKKIPTKLENDYYKSFDINLNDIKDSMNLIEENDKKYIEYGCNNYRISDEVKKINDSKFEILMKE